MFGFKRKGNGKSKEKVVSNVRVGKPQVKPTAPSHTAGVKRGNARGNFEKNQGLKAVANGGGARATARRSTSINPEARNPNDPRMPNLPPA